MVARSNAAAAAVMSALIIVGSTGCSGGTEPVGLGTPTDAAPDASAIGEPPATGQPTATASPDGEGGSEPRPGFTQPNLPGGEPRVIDLPEELPVRAPSGADDEESEVLSAVGRFMASWQAILFGADAELAGVYETATEPQLGRLTDFAREAAEREWVFTGDPMRLVARSVSVEGDRAEADLCLELPNWVEFQGADVRPYPARERYLLKMQRIDGRWLVSNAEESDAAACES